MLGGDWQAVGTALSQRIQDRGTTMTELAVRSGVSMTTVRELVHVLNTRKRRPQTLGALAEALGWPRDYLARVLTQGAEGAAAELYGLAQIRVELRELRMRVAALEAERHRE